MANNYYINNIEAPYIFNQLYSGSSQVFEQFRNIVSDSGENKKSDALKEEMFLIQVYLDTLVNNNNTSWMDTIEYQKILNQAYSLVSLKPYYYPTIGGLNNS